MKNPRLIVLLLAFISVLTVAPVQCFGGSNPIAFEITPYLSNIGENEATINWRLKSKGQSIIKYGITLDCEQGAIVLEDENIQHSVILSALNPDTQYHYKINNIYSGFFRTDKPVNKFRFVALGHTHGTERFNHYPDRLLLARIKELSPDFLVHMGDATFYNNADDFKEYFFDEFESLIGRVPIYISPGNHDTGWPFVYGLNIAPFKELFPYPYPKEIVENDKEVFYSVAKGNIQFLFISYTSPLGPDSLQRKWLQKTLKNSPFDFNVVVYGGAQSGYYDEKSLLDFLSAYKVDLVLKGDGSQHANDFYKEYRGLPIYFVGTSGGGPHSFLYFEHEGEHLSLKRINAQGQIVSAEWIYGKKRFERKVSLISDLGHLVTRKNKVTISSHFKIPLNSQEINGLQISLKSKKGKRAIVYAYITPDDITTTRRNEGGFRTQYHEFIGGKDDLVTISFPKENPLKSGNFKIKKLRVMVQALSGQIEDFKIQEMYLY